MSINLFKTLKAKKQIKYYCHIILYDLLENTNN